MSVCAQQSSLVNLIELVCQRSCNLSDYVQYDLTVLRPGWLPSKVEFLRMVLLSDRSEALSNTPSAKLPKFESRRGSRNVSQIQIISCATEYRNEGKRQRKIAWSEWLRRSLNALWCRDKWSVVSELQLCTRSDLFLFRKVFSCKKHASASVCSLPCSFSRTRHVHISGFALCHCFCRCCRLKASLVPRHCLDTAFKIISTHYYLCRCWTADWEENQLGQTLFLPI